MANERDLGQEPAFQELVQIFKNMDDSERERTMQYLSDMQKQEEIDNRNFYGTAEAAKLLHISEGNLRALLNKGKLRGKRLFGRWRIPKAVIDEMIKLPE